jgi:hypothetical protein
MYFDHEKANRQIIASNIDRHPTGRKLTPAAREAAIDFGAKAWKGNMGNGRAAEIGIDHATAGVLKD